MTGRVVVVTGATAGVGRATARVFASQGDSVALLARSGDGLAVTLDEMNRLGVASLALTVDVADADAVDAAATRVEDTLGPINVWVNNAMTSVLAPVQRTSPDEFRRVTEVTYLGCVHGTMSALRRMVPRDSGVIVQVSSALAHRAIPLQASYCGAKHAIKGFTDALRCELLHDHANVRVTMVALPGLNTPQFGWVKTTLGRHPQPVAPIYQPEVAARAICWAADHPRREIQVGMPTPLTIWAGRLAPTLVDRYLAITNYEGQQTDQPIDPDRPTNLWAPVPGDHGAHGIFDDGAKASSIQMAVVTRYRRHALVTTGLSCVGCVWARRSAGSAPATSGRRWRRPTGRDRPGRGGSL